MNILNDKNCSWINDLDSRVKIQELNQDENCEWLVVGAGYTGLSAARKLGQLLRNQKIIVVDARYPRSPPNRCGGRAVSEKSGRPSAAVS